MAESTIITPVVSDKLRVRFSVCALRQLTPAEARAAIRVYLGTPAGAALARGADARHLKSTWKVVRINTVIGCLG